MKQSISLKSFNVTVKPFQRSAFLQPTHEDNNNINSSENNNRNKILLILARVHMMTLIIMMSFVLISCCICCCYCYLQLLLLLVRCQRCNKMYIQTIIQQCKCVACNKRTNITTRTFTHMQAGIYIYKKTCLQVNKLFHIHVIIILSIYNCCHVQAWQIIARLSVYLFPTHQIYTHCLVSPSFSQSGIH